MIWKNPFYLRQTENIDSDIDFLRLFSVDALSFINDNSFKKMQYIRSSPGAGKTTIFKAFQANILNTLYSFKDNDNLNEFYSFVTNLNIIENGQIKLLSCLISCAKNYELIDELFENGRRQQVLFALLNVRITILFLKSIMSIKSLQKIEDLVSVSFKEYPDELLSLEEFIQNGYSLYNWAKEEEKKICNYLDSLSGEKPNFSLFYNSLFFIKLFEPNNIMFNGDLILNYSLIIFDDMQKLTYNQRKSIINCLYVMRPNLGVWIGERFEALTSNEIISTDANTGREFEKIALEDYWQKKSNGAIFKNILNNIADKRVKLSYSDTIGNFVNCIDDKFDYTKYSEKINIFINTIKTTIENDSTFGQKYLNIIKHIGDLNINLYEKAIRWEVLEIKYKREYLGQLSLAFDEEYNEESFNTFYNENKNVAEYYLNFKCKMPYYYGIERIKEISSYNIDQFLSFAGSIFEKCIAKSILQVGKKTNFKIKAEDQEKYINETVTQRWDDIIQRFEYGENIQNLIDNLCIISQKTRDRGTNPYAGGAATGVAITFEDIELLKTEQYKHLFNIITDCISSNYFEKRLSNHDNKSRLVLYYNRWICVKYSLPLKYGGWRPIKVEDLDMLILPRQKEDGNQLSFI
jgi:hypothetical protein